MEGPLDMRMDPTAGFTAADLVNRLPERELANLIYRWGEEHASRQIASAIVDARRSRPITTTTELAAVVRRSAGRSRRPGLDAATKTFQALRIHVNGELKELESALDASLKRLAPNGRLAVISFHSLEDRMVKQFMRRHSLADPMYAGLPDIPVHARPKLRLVGKAMEADDQEISRNPRSRSAHLRVAERLAPGKAA